MSAEEIKAAQGCESITCPLTQGIFSLPSTCTIPNGATPEDYCLSVLIGGKTQIFLIASVLLYLLGCGASMEVDRLKAVLKKPRNVIVGIFAQSVLNPVCMAGILALFGSSFSFGTRLMAILISAAPSGSGSNLFSVLGYGDVELSVTMTCLSSALAFVTMPFYVLVATKWLWPEDSADVKVSFTTIAKVAIMATAVPLIGLFIKEKVSKTLAEFLVKYGSATGALGIFVSSALFLADPIFRLGVQSMGPSLWICGICLNVAGLVLGYFTSKAAGLPRRCHRTIAFEVGAQNITIPLAVLTVTFGSGPVSTLFTPFAGVYTITSLIPNWGTVLMFRYLFPLPYDEKNACNPAAVAPTRNADTSK
jgi:BASS family bile acid:Na+ symporter